MRANTIHAILLKPILHLIPELLILQYFKCTSVEEKHLYSSLLSFTPTKTE